MIDLNKCQVCNGAGDIDLGQICLQCGGTGDASREVRADVSVMSFGGGVQSSAIAWLAIKRDPRLLAVTRGTLPDVWIFADTGDEPEEVYRHTERMRAEIVAAGFEFVTVGRPGRLGDFATTTAGSVQIPAWIEVAGRDRRAPLRRSCTREWKVRPIEKESRRIAGIDARKRGPSRTVAQWLGISRDEAQRMKVSDHKWQWNVYPLISMRWTREDCEDYLRSIGESAPKSACVFCPFHSDALWDSLSPADLERAIEVETAMVSDWQASERPMKLQTRPSLHPSGIPISERPWIGNEGESGSLDNECAGICGV